MTDKPDCERCRRIKSAIEQGLSPHEAREENGWDECSRDDCPMLPSHTASKLTTAVASAMPRRMPRRSNSTPRPLFCPRISFCPRLVDGACASALRWSAVRLILDQIPAGIGQADRMVV